MIQKVRVLDADERRLTQIYTALDRWFAGCANCFCLGYFPRQRAEKNGHPAVTAPVTAEPVETIGKKAEG